ncbi:MAG TPA: hypothetical protein VF786_01860 [Terriglobales bacterium]
MFVGSLGRRWVQCVQTLSVLFFLTAAALAQFAPSSEPSAEVFGGYSCFLPNGHYLKSDTSKAPNMPIGWGMSVFTPYGSGFGGVFDVSGNYGNGGSLHDVMFGAEYKTWKWKLQPFGEGLLGWSRRSPKNSPDQGAAAFMAGGGIDLRRNSRFAIRLFRADYLFSFSNPVGVATDQQTFWNSIRVQSGVLMTFGAPAEEGPVSVACVATPDKVHVGEPVSAKATPKGFVHRRKLSYEWQVNDGKLGSTAASAVVETAALAPGDYTLRATANDNGKGKHHQSASCTATFAVLELPKKEEPSVAESATAAEPAKADSQPLSEAPATKPEAKPATDAGSAKPEAQPETPATTPETKPAQSSAATDTTTAAPAEKPTQSAQTPVQTAPAAAEAAPTTQKSDVQPTINPPTTIREALSATEATVAQAPAEQAKSSAQPAKAAHTASTAPAPKTVTPTPQQGTAQTEPAGIARVGKPASGAPSFAAPATAETPSQAGATTSAAKQTGKKQRTTNAKKGAPKQSGAPKQPTSSQTAVDAPQQAAVLAMPKAVVSGEPAIISVRTTTPETTGATANCTTSAGTLHPDGGKLTLDTTGVPVGNVKVTCTEPGGQPLGSTVVEVTTTAKPALRPRKLNSVQFNNAKRPARVDNVGKQILRDAAHALQQSEPGSKLILVGHARAAEQETDKNLAERRANKAKAFLMDKQNGGGVDESSVTVHAGKADARRVDIYLAAPGATFNGKTPAVQHGVGGSSLGKKAVRSQHKVVEK